MWDRVIDFRQLLTYLDLTMNEIDLVRYGNEHLRMITLKVRESFQMFVESRSVIHPVLRLRSDLLLRRQLPQRGEEMMFRRLSLGLVGMRKGRQEVPAVYRLRNRVVR